MKKYRVRRRVRSSNFDADLLSMVWIRKVVVDFVAWRWIKKEKEDAGGRRHLYIRTARFRMQLQAKTRSKLKVAWGDATLRLFAGFPETTLRDWLTGKRDSWLGCLVYSFGGCVILPRGEPPRKRVKQHGAPRHETTGTSLASSIQTNG